MARLEERIALVTGAARGIGRAIAAAFASEGARVVMVDRRADALERAVASVPDAWGLVGDVSDETRVESIVDEVVARLGRLDVLVNNAAVQAEARLLDHSSADFRRS